MAFLCHHAYYCRFSSFFVLTSSIDYNLIYGLCSLVLFSAIEAIIFRHNSFDTTHRIVMFKLFENEQLRSGDIMLGDMSCSFSTEFTLIQFYTFYPSS